MSEPKQLLERAHAAATRVVPDPDGYERFLGYRDRRRRNQRLAAGGVALALALAAAGTAFSVLRAGDASRIGDSGVVIEVPDVSGPCGPADPCWDTDMFVVRPDGTDVTRLGYDADRDFAFSWSPDGERIAFYHAVGVEDGGRFDADADIYTMAADGSDVRRLTDHPGLDVFPVYSPDGSKIAFTRSDRAGVVDVYVMDADGGNVVPITEFDDEGLDDYHPTWSPDGERIAFVRGEVPPGAGGELWVIDADGSNARLLLEDPLVHFPAWSPDGTRIAVGTGDWPEVEVRILDLETGGLTDVGEGYRPVWAPDSSRLAISMPEGRGIVILDLALPGGRLIVQPTGEAAAWSPDGQWIAFNAPGLTATGSADDPPGIGQALAGFRDDGTPFLVVRHEDGSLTAVEAISPHVATGGIRKLLGWCASSQTFDDPFHGSRFDGYGRYLNGPAPTGLVRFDLEIVEEIPRFRLGDALAPLPRETGGDAPAGPLCLDTDVTPLVMPDVAASGLTPADLAATAPPEGSRWLVEGTLSLEPDGTALLCAEVQATTCLGGAPVEGPSIDGGDPLVVPGRWLVLVRNGTLVDPIRTVRP
jgi:hypothetical protein